jgi:hypothetical protein
LVLLILGVSDEATRYRSGGGSDSHPCARVTDLISDDGAEAGSDCCPTERALLSGV